MNMFNHIQKLMAMFSQRNHIRDFAILLSLGVIKLLIPLITSSDFGFHRDEFLYVSMGEHLDWGYLEVPPSIAFFAKISQWLLGNSIYAVRFFPALTGAITLVLTGLIARELGGRRFAQILASSVYLFSLIYLRINLLFQPVTFNLFYFVLAVYVFILILKKNEPKNWVILGLVVALGLLNKYTMLLFALGIAFGLLLTPQRNFYKNKWLWMSAAVAILVFLPNLIWQHAHGWPLFEHMQVLAERQLANVEPLTFILVQFLMNLYATPIWLTGLYFYFFSQDGKPFRAVGWLYVVMLVVLVAFSGKVYYLAPAYPMLFAAGAVMIEKYIIRTMYNWLKPVILVIVIGGNITLIPVGIPLFSVDTMIKYFRFTAKKMGTAEALRWETGKLHELPQDYADMLGWEEQVAQVAKVYHSLKDDEKTRCAIFASNYGEAGALDYYGQKYGLPKCISKGGSYWTWGYRNYSGELMITVGWGQSAVEYFYSQYELAAVFEYPHARESGIPIYLARNPKMTIEQIWSILKKHRY